MKRRSLTIVILVIVAVIIAVIVVDFLNNRPDRRGDNPYALEVDQYKAVDESLISHTETRKYDLGLLVATGMDLFNGKLYISGNSSVAILSPDGTASDMFEIPAGAVSIRAAEPFILVAYKDRVLKYDHDGALLQEWQALDERTVITNLDMNQEKVYVADAGNRRVIMYSYEGEIIGEFEGKAVTEAGHGFIVPSANFDLAVNSFGELWVVNPGKHAVENYTDEGRMRGYWESSSVEIEGFLGCCNPARITVTPDGNFVTSEKGLVRIKIYDQAGVLQSVVASPKLFKEEGHAPDVCVDENGVVYALDFDINMVRVFEPRKNG